MNATGSSGEINYGKGLFYLRPCRLWSPYSPGQLPHQRSPHRCLTVTSPKPRFNKISPHHTIHIHLWHLVAVLLRSFKLPIQWGFNLHALTNINAISAPSDTRKGTSQQQPRFNERKTILSGDTLRQNSFQELTDSRLQKAIHDLYCIVSDRITPSHTVSVHLETSMTDKLHFILNAVECVLDSRTAKQITVLAEMNATGSSGEINYGKGLFYLRPCRLWSPYSPGQLPHQRSPHRCLTVTSPKPRFNKISPHHTIHIHLWHLVAVLLRSFKLPIQWGFNLHALTNINAISAPSDTRKGTSQQQPRFNERKTILSGDTLRQNSFQELTDSRLQKTIHDLYCIVSDRITPSHTVSVHLETSMTDKLHFILNAVECVLDSRTAKQITVLAEMNATGSSGEINYGKGLFYLRPCRLWSPYSPGQLPHQRSPHRCLTVTSPKPRLNKISPHHTIHIHLWHLVAVLLRSFKLPIQWGFNLHALTNINAISAPSDTRKGTSQQQPRFNERKTILSGDTLRQNSFQELTDSRLQKTIHDLYCIVSDRITPSHTVSVHLETSMTDKLHFILNAVECVLDSRTAKQITVLAEMNATGSSGEINYGKGLFYLRPCRLWSPYSPGQLPHQRSPHRCLTVTSPKPRFNKISPHHTIHIHLWHLVAVLLRSFKLPIQWGFNLHALTNINAISAPSDTRKGTSQQQPRFNERKTILSGDTLRQNSFQELTDSRLQKAIHDLYCIVSDRITPSHTVSVHLETSMANKLHFILNAVECVLDSRTAKQITVLAEMNATGSSGEINYGKGLFYLRPCRLWSPYSPGQLPHQRSPHRCLTVTSPKPRFNKISPHHTIHIHLWHLVAVLLRSFKLPIQWGFNLHALTNINAISAPSDTRKGTSQQQPRFNERKTILSGDTLRQNSFQELTDSRLQKTIHDLYCIVSDRITPSHTVSVHLETSMTDKLHFILNAVECVLDSRTAKQITVLAEMNATGSSGEINYGKGLFYLRPCRLWSPYNPGQLAEGKPQAARMKILTTNDTSPSHQPWHILTLKVLVFDHVDQNMPKSNLQPCQWSAVCFYLPFALQIAPWIRIGGIRAWGPCTSASLAPACWHSARSVASSAAAA